MEKLSSSGDQAEKSISSIPPVPVPTLQDLENARVRQAIAEKQEREYTECLALALQAFGPGWFPSHRHTLIDKHEEDACRKSGARPRAAATVFTVNNAQGERRHFTVSADGQVVECESYEAGFGEMLLEAHPTMRIEVRGQLVAPHRYSLNWSGYELYTPKSAEQLAALRATRERRKAEKEEQQWREENPLLVAAGIRREDLEGD